MTAPVIADRNYAGQPAGLSHSVLNLRYREAQPLSPDRSDTASKKDDNMDEWVDGLFGDMLSPAVSGLADARTISGRTKGIGDNLLQPQVSWS